MTRAIPAVAIFLTVTATGWATDTKTPPAKAGASQGTSAEQDKAIEAAIKSKLAKSKIGLDRFTVRVQGGVAYWDGTTNVVQHKGSATRMAKTAGALRVVNNIRVSEAAKAKAADNLSQGSRRGDARRGDTRDQGRPAAASGSQTNPSESGNPSSPQISPQNDQPRLVRPTFPQQSGPLQ